MKEGKKFKIKKSETKEIDPSLIEAQKKLDKFKLEAKVINYSDGVSKGYNYNSLIYGKRKFKSKEDRDEADELSKKGITYYKSDAILKEELKNVKKFLDKRSYPQSVSDNEKKKNDVDTLVRLNDPKNITGQYYETDVGDGKKIPEQKATGVEDNGMSNKEIDKVMANTKGYAGCVPYNLTNLLYHKLNPNKGSMVINTDVSSGAGKHWTSIYYDDKEIDYYDPLGDPPSSPMMEEIKELSKQLPKGNRKLKINKVKVQSDDTKTCGLFATNFIRERERGKPFKVASGFKGSIPKNEEAILHYKDKFNFLE